MANDARIQLPPPGNSDPVKTEVYRIRGETVSIGGSVEWIIGTLAWEFAGSTRKGTKHQWENLKAYIMSQGLNASLQPELVAVAGYFSPRNLATHAAIVIAQTGETSQIFRLYHRSGQPRADLVTLDDLRADCAVVRAGYEAMQSIGRALDDDDPAVLSRTNRIAKAMLLSR